MHSSDTVWLMEKRERLFEKFPPVSTEEWMEKITADLRGADFSRKLVWKTRDGLDIMPFYRQEDLDMIHHRTFLPGEYPYVRGVRVTDNRWLIRQDITVKDYAAANAKALDILMRGITSLGFVIEDSLTISVENISLLLRGVHLESVEVNFSTAGRAMELLAAIRAVLESSGADSSMIQMSISADPLGRLAANGRLCVSVDEGLDYLAGLVREASAVPGMRCLVPSGIVFSNAGAGTVDELAYTLSLGNEYLAALTARGISPDMAARAMKFTLGIGPDFFPEIARLRAARMLWAVIVKAYGPETEEAALMHVHAVTGRCNKTLYDPYVNMLRTQTEAMSAVLGGAASVTVEPFDAVFRRADTFSERIARNQQLLLMEEAHLDKVADPGAGSYYIEEVTSLISGAAWRLFLELEEEGGFLKALKKGIIQRKTGEAAASRRSDIARRKETLLGTNQYPDFRERRAPEHDMTLLFPVCSHSDDEEVTPLVPSRGSEDFEKLRLATEGKGRRPVAFMLTIGDLAMRRARAQFSSNFFAVAGYDVRDNNGFGDAAGGVNAALEAGADIVVICSSDEEYATLAGDIFRMVNGKALVVVAGNPPCSEELKKQGLEHFISIRSNVLETMQMFNRKLGIN